jgi:hypothetical protein
MSEGDIHYTDLVFVFVTDDPIDSGQRIADQSSTVRPKDSDRHQANVASHPQDLAERLLVIAGMAISGDDPGDMGAVPEIVHEPRLVPDDLDLRK